MWTARGVKVNGGIAFGAVFCRWFGGRRFFLFLKTINLLNKHENGKGDDDEIENRVDENPVFDRDGLSLTGFFHKS